MKSYARTAPGERPSFITCKRPFSNFDYVDDHFDGSQPLRRTLSQVRLHGAQTMVVEKVSSANDLAEENDDIAKLCLGFDSSRSEAYRISFFLIDVDENNIANIPDDAFLGYAILKQDKVPPTPLVCPSGSEEWRIYESVLRESRHANNFIHGAPVWTCCVSNRAFKVIGYLYAQQNAITNSCAHVAVRTAATRFLGKDLSYRQMNNWVPRIQKASGQLSLPGRGLTSQEICKILENAGATTFVGDYTVNPPPVPYQNFVYGSIESGYPAILFFSVDRRSAKGAPSYHTVPVLGHTFCEDTWVADADSLYFPFRIATRSLSSGTWVSMFVAHDDNAGSNYCIPQHYMESNRLCQHLGKVPTPCKQQHGNVAFAIGTLPKEVVVDPIRAEAIGADYLLAVLAHLPKNGGTIQRRWLDRLDRHAKQHRLVLRSILLRGTECSEHLAKIRGWGTGKQLPTWIPDIVSQVAKSDFLWMVELSIPELFSANRRKVGEILILATHPTGDHRDFKSFFCARVPGYFVVLTDLPKNPGKTMPTFKFYPIELDDHVSLLGCENDS